MIVVRASDDPSVQLARGESLHTEFKGWPIPPDDLAAALVAFANTDGGRVFLGVDDLGVAAGGVGDLDRATQFVDNVAFNNCSPPVTVLQETVETAGGTVLAVNVPKGDDRPYRTTVACITSAPHPVAATPPGGSCCACFSRARACSTTRPR